MGSKYLFVINSFLAGGAERSLIELLPQIVQQGDTPIIACMYRREVGFENEVREAGFDVRLLPGANFLNKVLSLRRLIKVEQPDLIYTTLFDSDVAGRLAAARLRIPVMTNLANTAYDDARLGDPNVSRARLRIVRWVDGFTARHLTSHFHAISQAVKDSAVEKLGVAPDRITVVKRGRDRVRLGESFSDRRIAIRRKLGVANDAEVLVSVGRQEYQKGHSYLVDAFVRIVSARPKAVLLIAGREGHVSTGLREQVARLRLERAVTLLGHRDDITDVLAGADLFVFPSLYEGLGGAVIEAMGLGLPVVASDLAALREVVRDGENADLVSPGDPDALASAIVSLLSDEARLHRYGQRSRELFESEFRADDAAQRLLDLLRQVAR